MSIYDRVNWYQDSHIQCSCSKKKRRESWYRHCWHISTNHKFFNTRNGFFSSLRWQNKCIPSSLNTHVHTLATFSSWFFFFGFNLKIVDKWQHLFANLKYMPKSWRQRIFFHSEVRKKADEFKRKWDEKPTGKRTIFKERKNHR